MLFGVPVLVLSLFLSLVGAFVFPSSFCFKSLIHSDSALGAREMGVGFLSTKATFLRAASTNCCWGTNGCWGTGLVGGEVVGALL